MQTKEWLLKRLNHPSLTVRQRESVEEIAKNHLEYTPTKIALNGNIYDSAFITINAITHTGKVPVQYTRQHRRPGEPKYKSSTNWDAVIHLMPDVRCKDVLVITEGFSKAVACYLLGYESIALPGITCCKKRILDRVLETTCQEILIIFDSSKEENPEVEKASANLGAILVEQGKNAKVIKWEMENSKGLDDVLKDHGKYLLERILNKEAREEKQISGITSGNAQLDLAETILKNWDVTLTLGGYRIKGQNRSFTKAELKGLLHKESKLYRVPDKKGILKPIINLSASQSFCSYFFDLISQKYYNNLKDPIFFADDEVTHYQDRVSYTRDYCPVILQEIEKWLPSMIENPEVFRALCRKVLVAPGQIEKDSLAIFFFLGNSGTGKSFLGSILNELVGGDCSYFQVKDLNTVENMGNLEWKRIMRDDDLGGCMLNKNSINQLLNMAKGQVSIRKLHRPGETLDWPGTVVLMSTDNLAHEKEVGLKRRLKTIRTKFSESHRSITSIPLNTLLPAMAEWALSMPDKEYVEVLDTNAKEEIRPFSDLEQYLNGSLVYSSEITPIRELYHNYCATRIYRTPVKSFVDQVSKIMIEWGGYALTIGNEPGFKGHQLLRSKTNDPGEIPMGGEYKNSANKQQTKQ